jgi:LPXTG-site transpeptidase (sortase) family protein
MTKISPEWQKTVDFYLGLSLDQRKKFLQKLNPAQANFLQTLIAKKPVTISVGADYQTQHENKRQNPETKTSVDQIGTQAPKAFTPIYRPQTPFLPAGISSREINAKSIFSKKEYLKSKKASRNKYFAKATVIILLFLVPLLGVSYALGLAKPVQEAIVNADSLAKTGYLSTDKSDQAFVAWFAKNNKTPGLTPDKLGDPDQDTLTNFEEFKIGTLPDKFSSCGNGKGDGENILNSIDPVNCKLVNFNDVDIAQRFETVITRQTLNDRLSLLALDSFKRKKVAGVNDSLADITESTKTATAEIPEITLDLEQKGNLSIPILNDGIRQDYPISWLKSIDRDTLDASIKDGAVFYPGTTLPGEAGNMYLAGRNDQENKSNPFNFLDKLNPGDEILVQGTLKNGKSKIFIYKVKSMNIIRASDTRQFNSSKTLKEITLATAWPRFINDQRLVLKGSLDRIEDVN